MASTLAELRKRLREMMGDSAKIDGTATGGSVTTLEDTTLLTQADDFWNNYTVHIDTTTDGNAPEGESREISDFAAGSDTLTIRHAFTAGVASGDTYSIAAFGNCTYKEAINAATRAFTFKRPLYTTTALNVTSGTKRYDKPTGSIRIDRIAYINDSTQEEYEYEFIVEDHDDKIAFPYWWTENKALTVFHTKEHTELTTDASTSTYPDRYEEAILKFAFAEMLLSLSKLSFDKYGELAPTKWTRGKISEDYSTTKKNISDMRIELIAEFNAEISKDFVGMSKTGYEESGLEKKDWKVPKVFLTSSGVWQ